MFHMMDAGGLKALTPGFDWDAYMKTAGLYGLNAFIVTEPDFLKEVGRQWQSLSLSDIKSYLRWHAVYATAPLLSSAFLIERNDFFGNAARASLFESRRRLAKIGKPLDRGEWDMTPPTVNAYYNAHMNDINFAAGVLQPPLYDPKMDDAPNYGNTGGTIGHELTHGFDDEGRQFDAQGNLKDWWTEKDAKEFNDRAQCIVDQYAQYTIVDDIKINSKLTLGEDIADLGGLVLAWLAWKAETAGTEPESRDGFTPEQRFFVGYAQWACESNRPEV